MKNTVFPLTLRDIAKLLGKEEDVEKDLTGFVMIKESKLKGNVVKREIDDVIFKNVYEEWTHDRSVVVGQDKLLCHVELKDFNIIEKAPSIGGMTLLKINAKVYISHDPEHEEDMKVKRTAERAAAKAAALELKKRYEI